MTRYEMQLAKTFWCQKNMWEFKLEVVGEI